MAALILCAAALLTITPSTHCSAALATSDNAEARTCPSCLPCPEDPSNTIKKFWSDNEYMWIFYMDPHTTASCIKERRVGISESIVALQKSTVRNGAESSQFPVKMWTLSQAGDEMWHIDQNSNNKHTETLLYRPPQGRCAIIKESNTETEWYSLLVGGENPTQSVGNCLDVYKSFSKVPEPQAMYLESCAKSSQ
ncbi:uncharacterized protein LOC119373622 isoform X2 [Rhipicephalus sanguineus]|uniref:uncharacterized protein LOC119373622 isoform X2 n=1 Tax=Rhipicephalus sanguineus TaxID=34632 RepID=UPI001894368D|nr:uncharacterized protein LOC119373622 isoform X2 [Rhipicephalus sanguineus]